MHLLTLEEWITTVLVKAIGWTFSHSLWQGLAALLTAYTALSLMKKAKPAARHNILILTYLLFIASVIITFIVTLQAASVIHTDATGNSPLGELLNRHGTGNIPAIIESRRIIDVMLQYFNEYIELFVAVWFIIFCVKWFMLSLNFDYVNRISRFESAPAERKWQAAFEELKAKLHINKEIKLLQSSIVKVPLVSGVLKPIILVPAGMLANMPADLIEPILLHELAHIRRSDYLVNIIQSCVETVFFFNPFLLKLSELIKEEREACCDAIAVDATNNKVSYVQALVACGEYTTSSAPALAFAGSKNHLLHRVKRILYNQNKKPGFMEKSVLFGSVILLTLITAFTTIRSEMKTAIVPVQEIKAAITDTVPAKVKEDKVTKNETEKRKKKMREAQLAIQLSEEQLEEIQEQVEKVPLHIENKIQMKELQEQMIQLNAQLNIQNEQMLALKQLQAPQVEQVLKSIDLLKINKELQEAYALKDLEHTKAMTLKSADQIKLQQSLIDSVSRFNFDLNVNTGMRNDDVSAILHFLEKNKVADVKDVKDFTLTEDELTVNGKRQASSLHEELKQKYIRSKGDHIIYSYSGGSRSIIIRRNDPI